MMMRNQEMIADKLGIKIEDIVTHEDIEAGFEYWEVVSNTTEVEYLICLYNNENPFNYDKYNEIKKELKKIQSITMLYLSLTTWIKKQDSMMMHMIVIERQQSEKN